MVKLKDILNENTVMEEGLIVTHPLEKTVQYLNNFYQNYENKLSFFKKSTKDPERNKFVWMVDNPSKKFIDSIVVIINNFGWFPSHYSSLSTPTVTKKFNLDDFMEDSESDNVGTMVFFEPKFDNKELESGEIPNVVYHISPIQFKKKILEIGLIPKSKEKMTKHPDRIYLAKDKDSALLLLKNKNFILGNNLFSLYEIQLENLVKKKKVRVFTDVNFKDFGFYTMGNISPEYIKFVEDIEI